MPTPNSGIPYVPENTIDPAAGFNDSLRVIDALIQAAVIGYQEVSPPTSPGDGDRYIVGDGSTGAWSGQDQNMAQYVSEGNFWQFYEAGTQVNLVLFNGTLYAYESGWSAVSGGGGGPTNPDVQAVTSASTVTPTFSNDLVKITAQEEGLTLANPAGTPVDGWGLVIRVKDNGTARAISYGTQYRAIGVTLPTTTVVGKTLYLAGIWNTEDTTLDIVAVGQQA